MKYYFEQVTSQFTKPEREKERGNHYFVCRYYYLKVIITSSATEGIITVFTEGWGEETTETISTFRMEFKRNKHRNKNLHLFFKIMGRRNHKKIFKKLRSA